MRKSTLIAFAFLGGYVIAMCGCQKAESDEGTKKEKEVILPNETKADSVQINKEAKNTHTQTNSSPKTNTPPNPQQTPSPSNRMSTSPAPTNMNNNTNPNIPNKMSPAEPNRMHNHGTPNRSSGNTPGSSPSGYKNTSDRLECDPMPTVQVDEALEELI